MWPRASIPGFWGVDPKFIHISDVLTAGGFNARRNDLWIFIRYQPKKNKEENSVHSNMFHGTLSSPTGIPPFVSCLLAIELLDSLSVFFRGEKAGWVELFGRNLRAMLGIRMGRKWAEWFWEKTLTEDPKAPTLNKDRDKHFQFFMFCFLTFFHKVPGS